MNTGNVFIFGFSSSVQLPNEPADSISVSWHLPNLSSLNCNPFISVKTIVILSTQIVSDFTAFHAKGIPVISAKLPWHTTHAVN